VGNKVEKNVMGVACSTYGGGPYRVLVHRPEGKKPIGRHRQINRRIILRWICIMWVGGHGLD